MKKLFLILAISGMAFGADLVLKDFYTCHDKLYGEKSGIVKPGTYAVIEVYGGWTKVTLNGQAGKVGTQFIDADGVILGQGCALQALDGKGRITTLKAGTKVDTHEMIVTWQKINNEAKEVWINKAQ